MAYYDARELQEIHEGLVERGLSWRRYMLLRDLVQSSCALSLKDVAVWSAMSRSAVQKYLPLLRAFEDVHVSRFKGEIWLVYASEQEATICRRRKISLMVYARLRPFTEELTEDLKRYYERHLHQGWREPVEAMGDIKERWAQRLHEHRMTYRRARVFIRTIQDLVLQELGVPREVVDRWLAENGELDLDDTEPDEIYEMEEDE